MEEARKDKRVSAEFPVRVKSATVGEFVDRLAADVSVGGIFIQAEPPLDVGTLVRVEFHIEDGTQLCTGVGRVVWNRGEDVATPERPVGMGVKFVRVDTATKDVLSSFVEQRASEVSIDRRVVVLPESTLSQRPPPESEEIAAPATPAASDEARESAPADDGASAEKADVSSLAALDARGSSAESDDDEEADDDEGADDDDRDDESARDSDDDVSGERDDESDDGDDEEEEDDDEEDEAEAPAAAAPSEAKKDRPSQPESRRSKKRGKKARKEEARQRKREQKQAAAEVARKEQTERPKPAKERPSRPQELPVAEAQSGTRSLLPMIVIAAIIVAIVLGIYFYSTSQSDSNRSPGQESSAD